MGEKTAYYIPYEQAKFYGKEEFLADLFWEKGTFLATKKGHIYQRIKEFEGKGIALPVTNHEFSFGEMGISDEGMEIPIPSNVYDAKCPSCNAEVYEAFTESLSQSDSENLRDVTVKCQECSHEFKASQTIAEDPGFEFARVYLWVSDIYDEDWESKFKSTVEAVLGPCREIIAWDT